MHELRENIISCPYCGEFIEITIDCSEPEQNYIEDCQVCCRPINISVEVDLNNQLTVIAKHEKE